MRIEEIKKWNQIVSEGKGFIFNDFGTQFPGKSPSWNTRSFNKLHKCACTQVKRMTFITEGKLTKHFFLSERDALSWLGTNRKDDGYTLCCYCMKK